MIKKMNKKSMFLYSIITVCAGFSYSFFQENFMILATGGLLTTILTPFFVKETKKELIFGVVTGVLIWSLMESVFFVKYTEKEIKNIMNEKVLNNQNTNLGNLLNNPSISLFQSKELKEIKPYIKTLTMIAEKEVRRIFPRGGFILKNNMILWDESTTKLGLSGFKSMDVKVKLTKVDFLINNRVSFLFDLTLNKKLTYKMKLNSDISIENGNFKVQNLSIEYDDSFEKAAMFKERALSKDTKRFISILKDRADEISLDLAVASGAKRVIMSRFQDDEYHLKQAIDSMNETLKNEIIDIDVLKNQTKLKSGFNRLKTIPEKDELRLYLK